jgi:uncharacterized membrane protein
VDEITKSIIIKGEISQICAVWKDFANFPRCMKNIEAVMPRGDGFSHWVMRGPLDIRFDWDAKTTLMKENSRIAWKRNYSRSPNSVPSTKCWRQASQSTPSS